MGEVTFTGGAPEAGDDVESNVEQGVTSTPTPVVEQVDDAQPEPQAVDERGVPWKNVAAEAKRKLEKEAEWNKRYREEAEAQRQRADQIEQNFQVMMSQQQAVQSTPPVTAASINPALAAGQPATPAAAQPAPTIDPIVAQLSQQVQNLEYRGEFEKEVKSVVDAYPALSKEGTDFNRQVDWEFGRVEREYAAQGLLPPSGTLKNIADATFGRMVSSGELDPNSNQPLSNAPTASAPPSVSSTPATGGIPGNTKIPQAILEQYKRSGIDPADAIKQMQEHPEKYRGAIEAIESLGGHIGR